MSAQDHIHRSAALRGLRKFSDAIAEIENNLHLFDDITIVPALLQAFYAAHEAGDVSKAKGLACEIAKRDPNIPSIKTYL